MSRFGSTQHGSHEEEMNTNVSIMCYPSLPPSSPTLPLPSSLSFPFPGQPQSNSKAVLAGGGGGLTETADTELKPAFTLEGPRPPGCRRQKCITLQGRGRGAEEGKSGEEGTDGQGDGS